MPYLLSRSFVIIIISVVLFFSVSYAQPSKQRSGVIKMARSYKGGPIENITPTADYKGAIVRTKNGQTYFLNREATKQELGITITDNGFILPKDASVTYYDQNGVPSDNYYNYSYADTKQGLSFLVKIPLIEIRSDSVQPLYIINGKEALKEELAQINPSNIEKMDVLKSDAAVLAYGDRGRNGVVVITLKPLYIINGKESSKEEMTKLDASTIEKVNVLNRDSAISIFGEKGKSGVVVITLKQQPIIDTAKTSTEVTAAFPGGTQAWRRYIEKSVRYPRSAQESRTMGKVRVSVTVAKDGSLSAVPITSLGHGLEEEAIRIMKESPKWSPATRDGVPVTYTFNQSVSFYMQ